jgi:hypothetical protein
MVQAMYMHFKVLKRLSVEASRAKASVPSASSLGSGVPSARECGTLAGHLMNLGRHALLEDELGDAVTRANHKGLDRVQILQDHLDLARIVGVDDAREGIESVLHGQSRTRCNTSVTSWGERDRDAGRDDNSATRKHNVVVNTEEIVANGPGCGARRQSCMRNQLRDIECHTGFSGGTVFIKKLT